MTHATHATELFRSGCACSQAVLAPYCDRFGLDRAQAMRLAAGFAGGMRAGETCGAATGAYMVLGLAHGGEPIDRIDGRKEVYAGVQEFSERFRARHGSLKCRDLLGCDTSTPEGSRQAHDQNLFQTLCPTFVGGACTILDEMLPPS